MAERIGAHSVSMPSCIASPSHLSMSRRVRMAPTVRRSVLRLWPCHGPEIPDERYLAWRHGAAGQVCANRLPQPAGGLMHPVAYGNGRDHAVISPSRDLPAKLELFPSATISPSWHVQQPLSG